MEVFNIYFDLDFKGETKHIEVTAIDIILNQEVLKIVDFTSGAILEWNMKDITKLRITTIV